MFKPLHKTERFVDVLINSGFQHTLIKISMTTSNVCALIVFLSWIRS